MKRSSASAPPVLFFKFAKRLVMQLKTYHYNAGQGWSQPFDSTLDSQHTMLLVLSSLGQAKLESGLKDLRRAFPNATWVGCSTAGEICGDALMDQSLVVAVARFEHTRLRLASATIAESSESQMVGTQLGAALDAPDLKAVFLLSDGLCVNGSSLIKGLTDNLDGQVIVTGGLAGDGDRFETTWVMQDQAPQSHRITAVGLYGERLRVSHGSKGGWDLLGPERRITGSRSNVLQSIDGQPALALYKKYLGERANGLPATALLFPLAILNTHAKDGVTVRTVLSVNEEENSITFAGDVPEGSTVRLMSANFERLINGAGEAAASIMLDDYRGNALLTIGISCIGRRLVLGQRTEEEIEEVRHALPAGSELVGFYSYGEISPLASGRCDLHNQTMTLTSFWET